MEYHEGCYPATLEPSLILVSSLFTYSWQPVHKTIEYYRDLYPRATIRLGGIYATLMPEHARLAGADEVHLGLVPQCEGILPDYSITGGWDSSIMFGTRGCVRKCAFCAVPRLEGKTWGPAEGIGHMIDPSHKQVVLWDNNILSVPNWRDVVRELKDRDVSVDFNQGLDARFITEEVAGELAGLRLYPVRMAYDLPSERRALERAIPAMASAGFRRKSIVVYTLFNFTDTPEDFLARVIDLLSWGVVSYPMRYEPLSSLTKNRYVSPHWTARQLEMVARARRVMGFGGAFPPYTALLEKFRNAATFEEAFAMRASDENRRWPEEPGIKPQDPYRSLSTERDSFREVLNDPLTLATNVTCHKCSVLISAGERAFVIQDYAGNYVGYFCPSCHPNRKWINGLWRSVLGDALSFSEDSHFDVPVLDGVISRPVHGPPISQRQP